MSPNNKFFGSTHAIFYTVPIQSDIVKSEVILYSQQTEGETAGNDGDETSDSSDWELLPTNNESTITLIKKLINPVELKFTEVGEEIVENVRKQAMVQTKSSKDSQEHRCLSLTKQDLNTENNEACSAECIYDKQ